jgi:NAD(P)-dependent dehydrogenase (short-subunit alcohol dehydrogenase family)
MSSQVGTVECNVQCHTDDIFWLIYTSGKQTVLHLAQHNAKVYLCARSSEKAQRAIEEIRARTKRTDLRIAVLVMDMLDLQSVKNAAQQILRYSTSSCD